jgi:ATP adenylyltransferase
MEPEKINHSYLTAIKRTNLSVPTRYLLQHNLLKGRILDFGCGYGFDTDELKRQGYNIRDMIIIIGLNIQLESLILFCVIMS